MILVNSIQSTYKTKYKKGQQRNKTKTNGSILGLTFLI